MSRYRRARTPGATFFFTVTLADRRSTLLADEIGRLRTAWRRAAQLHPFETIAVCILPDHLHAIWTLPPLPPLPPFPPKVIAPSITAPAEICCVTVALPPPPPML